MMATESDEYGDQLSRRAEPTVAGNAHMRRRVDRRRRRREARGGAWRTVRWSGKAGLGRRRLLSTVVVAVRYTEVGIVVDLALAVLMTKCQEADGPICTALGL